MTINTGIHFKSFLCSIERDENGKLYKARLNFGPSLDAYVYCSIAELEKLRDAITASLNSPNGLELAAQTKPTPTIAEKIAALRDPTLEIQNPTSALDDLDPRDSRYG